VGIQTAILKMAELANLRAENGFEVLVDDISHLAVSK
jgi:hypothetical protein